MKNILILGAGLMQKPAIYAVKKAGFRAVVVDGNPNAVCVSLADDFRHIDLKDKMSLVELAKELQENGGIEAVFTAGTDFSSSVACVAESIGLPGHSLQSAMNASDKTLMRSCFEKENVPSPKFLKVTKENLDIILSQKNIDSMEFPLVIKPVDNMGGRGCRMIREKEEVVPAIKYAVKNSRSSTAILEDYMEGHEYSIDSILYDGKLFITGFADRHIKWPPYFIEVGHTMPTDCSYKQYCELVSAFALGIKSLGLTRGACKADIKYTKNGAMIGEIAARLSGGYMSGWTYPYASDCQLTEQAIFVSCGKTAEYLESNKKKLEYIPPKNLEDRECPFELYDVSCIRSSAERAWISIPGVVRRVSGLEDAKKVPFVKDVLPRLAVGSCAVFPRNNVEKGGNIITVAPTRQEAIEAAEKAISLITVRLEPNNKETDSFLSGLSELAEKGFPPAAFELDEKTKKGFIEFKNKAEVIPENVKVTPLMPSFLKEFSQTGVRDWNYCTVEQVAQRFDSLCPKHKKFDAYRFWKVLILGGIQGVLYAADSE